MELLIFIKRTFPAAWVVRVSANEWKKYGEPGAVSLYPDQLEQASAIEHKKSKKNLVPAGGEQVQDLYLDSELDISAKNLAREGSSTAALTDFRGQGIRRQRLRRLVVEYQARLDRDPHDVEALLGIARAWEALGSWSAALSFYQEVIALQRENEEARRGIEKIHHLLRPRLRFHVSFTNEDNYLPSLDEDMYSWRERSETIQVGKQWGPDKYLAMGWLHGIIEQQNNFYGDTDFALKRQGPFFHVEYPLLPTVRTKLRVRDERFEDDGTSGFFQLGASKHLVTGYMVADFIGDSWWASLSYNRERDPEPVFDQATGRASLNIEVQELTGLTAGWNWAYAWELFAGVFYEQYGSERPDQFNYNGQVIYQPIKIPGLRLALGAGYYTEEQETINNLTTSYQWRTGKGLAVRLEHQLEYSKNYDSLLNQGEVLFSTTILRSLALTVRAVYGQESGGDKDSFFQAESGLEYRFF